jgi:hypothetical protein
MNTEKLSNALIINAAVSKPSARRHRQDQEYEPVFAKTGPDRRIFNRVYQGGSEEDGEQRGSNMGAKRRRVGFVGGDDDAPSERFVSTPAQSKPVNRKGTPYPGKTTGLSDDDNDGTHDNSKVVGTPGSARRIVKAKKTSAGNKTEKFPVKPKLSLIVENGKFSFESEREHLGLPIQGDFIAPEVIPDDIPLPDNNYTGTGMIFFKEEPLPTIKRKSNDDDDDDEATGPESKRMKEATLWECKKCNTMNDHDESKCKQCQSYRPLDPDAPIGWGGLFEGVSGRIDDPNAWRCLKCRVLNASEAAKCSACEANKPTPEEVAADKLAEEQKAKKLAAALAAAKGGGLPPSADDSKSEKAAKADESKSAVSAMLSKSFGNSGNQTGGSGGTVISGGNFFSGSTALPTSASTEKAPFSFGGNAVTLAPSGAPAPAATTSASTEKAPFSFGGKAVTLAPSGAPAPAATVTFSFGNQTPAAAPAGESTATAPAISSTGFSFGSPAPAQSASTPAPGGFSFGGTPAAAPAPSTFLETTSPTPASSAVTADSNAAAPPPVPFAGFGANTAQSSGKKMFGMPALPFQSPPSTSTPSTESALKRRKDEDGGKEGTSAAATVPFPLVAGAGTNPSFQPGSSSAALRSSTPSATSASVFGSVPSSNCGGESQHKKRRSRDDHDPVSGRNTDNASISTTSGFGTTPGSLFGSGATTTNIGQQTSASSFAPFVTTDNNDNEANGKMENNGDSTNKTVFTYGDKSKKEGNSSTSNGSSTFGTSQASFSFGSSGATSASISGPFGQGPSPAPAPSSGSNLFGNSTSAPGPPLFNSTSSSAFGSTPASSNAVPPFGANPTPGVPATQFGSGNNNAGPNFGSSAPSSTANPPFGSSNASFGSAAPALATSFGSTATPGAASSGFGSTPAPAGPFGAQGAPPFGSAPAPAAPFANTGQSAGPSAFGGFGSTSQAPAQFGGAPAPAAFGQPQANPPGGFGQPGGAFGSGGGFGQQAAPLPPQPQPGGFAGGAPGVFSIGSSGPAQGNSGRPRGRRIVKARRPGGSRPA